MDAESKKRRGRPRKKAADSNDRAAEVYSVFAKHLSAGDGHAAARASAAHELRMDDGDLGRNIREFRETNGILISDDGEQFKDALTDQEIEDSAAKAAVFLYQHFRVKKKLQILEALKAVEKNLPGCGHILSRPKLLKAIEKSGFPEVRQVDFKQVWTSRDGDGTKNK